MPTAAAASSRPTASGWAATQSLAEAVAGLEGRYADDISTYDEIHVQILRMADTLSDGIIAQFPARFAK